MKIKKRILITGGTGFLGFHLAKNLCQNKNYSIVLFDNFFRSKNDKDLQKLLAENKNIKIIKGDLLNPKDIKKIGYDYDYVYHLAAVNGTKNFYIIPDKVLKINILSCINILDWFLKCHKDSKIIFASSSEVYAGTTVILPNFPIPTPEDIPLTINNPYNPRWSYAGSKILGELLFINYAKINQKRMSIVRFHNVYGPRMGFDHVIPEFLLKVKKKENPFVIWGGKETRSFCYVDDMVKATQKVMETSKTDGETINIGNSDEEITIKSLAEKIFKITGFFPKIKIKKAPQGSVLRRMPDLKKIKRLTNFFSSISLEDGLKITWDWHKKNI